MTDHEKALVERVSKFYSEAGASIAGNLKCEKCGTFQPCSASDAAYFLRYGWPVHCGQQMGLARG